MCACCTYHPVPLTVQPLHLCIARMGGGKKIGSRDPIEREFDPPAIFFFRKNEILELFVGILSLSMI